MLPSKVCCKVLNRSPGGGLDRSRGYWLSILEVLMDIAKIVKDAAWIGLATGVVVMALVMVYLAGRELMQPKAIALAAVPKPPIGFCLPSLRLQRPATRYGGRAGARQGFLLRHGACPPPGLGDDVRPAPVPAALRQRRPGHLARRRAPSA